MNIFDIIKNDHKEVLHLLEQLTSTSGQGDTRKVAEQFQRLRQELIPHIEAEEKLFYPMLMERASERDPVMEALEEHHLAKIVLGEMTELCLQDPHWRPKAKVFMELISHHVKEEESEVFESAQAVVDKNLSVELGKDFQKEKESVKQRVFG